MQYIPKDHYVYVPPSKTRRDMDIMFDDYLNYMAPEEAQSTIVESDCNYVDGYIWWFFGVSHSYVIHDTPEDPSRSALWEIQEDEHVRTNHVVDVLPRCRHTLEI